MKEDTVTRSYTLISSGLLSGILFGIILWLVFFKEEPKQPHTCPVCQPCLSTKEVLRINALYESFVDDSHYAQGKERKQLRDSVNKYKRMLNIK